MDDNIDLNAETIPAGFWMRAGAYMIDSILVSIPLVPLLVILKKSAPEVGSLMKLLAPLIYFTVVPVLYRGQTIGKRIAGIAIVRMDGSSLGYGRAFLRGVGYMISSLIAGLGFMMAAFTDKKRALHDIIAGTRVVQVKEVTSGRKAVILAGALFLPAVAFVGILAAIAIPQFARFQNKAKETITVAQLGSLRTELEMYAGDHDEKYPTDLSLLVPKYRDKIEPIWLADHPGNGSTPIRAYSGDVCSGSKDADSVIDGFKLKDTGGFGYVTDPKAACFGHLFVDCTHKRVGGNEWYRY